MGNNSTYNNLAKIVIDLYNKKALTRDILETMLEPLRGTDLDTGDDEFYKTNDGKTLLEIMCLVMHPVAYSILETRYKNLLKNTSKEEAFDNFKYEIYELYENKIASRYDFW